ncbi:PAS domain-containing protein [Virgibacillus soli]|uniref:PAS domain-containing protein n=1 Tax=Paracerasibacillus soli TaxID=480284 RepID=UPI0035E9F3CD
MDEIASHFIFLRRSEKMAQTPISIGRNVANCHPPNSMSKVMRLIRDLKTKRRVSENMWFRKGDHYIHITYKAVFDDEGEYVGILEYVQDIQPFLDLPREVKRELRKLDE